MSLVNRVFKPFLDSFMIVFSDEILVYLRSIEEHSDHLHIIRCLRKKLHVKFSKWNFS